MCDGISGTRVWSEHAERTRFGVLPSLTCLPQRRNARTP